ncbi:MAG: chemotaxis protein CheX [Phycisphaerales bacterium]|nr:chemotaxis protein CheX [Phycisphaerales bacterium]
MDTNIVLPFIRATRDIFEMMLQLEAEAGEPTVKQSGKASHDISGIIGFTGDVEGAVVLSFPEATAQRVCAIFTGSECAEQEDLCDAIGELTNMIAGSAKAQFKDRKASISCPSVVIGADHVVHSKKGTVCVQIPFTCDCGEFAVEFAIKNVDSGTPTGAATPAAATN